MGTRSKIANDYKDILLKRFHHYSAYFDSRSRGVSWLISRSFTASRVLVFADPEDRLCVVDVTIKGKSIRFIRVYAPNGHAKRATFFRRVEPF